MAWPQTIVSAQVPIMEAESMAPKFSFWVGVCFTLNCVVGSGFLTLPWAFQKTGTILGVTALAVFGYFSVLATVFILESSARAAHILERKGDTEMAILKHKEGYSAVATSEETSQAVPASGVVKRRIEMSEMCRMFLGTTGRDAFAVLLSVYMYGVLWAYCTVFSKAFSVQFPWYTEERPEEGATYYVYLFFFACFVVPFSTMELSEQIYVQVGMTIFRVVLLSLMLYTAFSAYVSCGNDFGVLSSKSCAAAPTGEDVDSSLTSVHFENLYMFLPLAAYAYIFQYTVPALSAPVEDKRSLGRMFAVALTVAFVAYSLLGGMVSAYFGKHTQNSSNLDWQHYQGTLNADGTISMGAAMIASFVVLFPAADVASTYPINAFALGNNLMSAYYGAEIAQHEKCRFTTSVFRLIAALPPFLGAICVRDLGHITAYTGLLGFAIAFVFPPLLAYYSAKKMQELNMSEATVHSSEWTNTKVQYTVGGIGVVLIVVVFACLVTYGTDS
jgi:amino acid permease